jgi:hypothetical protein
MVIEPSTDPFKYEYKNGLIPMNFLENEIYYHESHEGDTLDIWDRQVVKQN